MALFETLLYCPINGFSRLDMHLARAARSCAALAIPFKSSDARQLLSQLCSDQALRCRLDICDDGQLYISSSPLAAAGKLPWRIALATVRLNANDPMLRHKVSDRKLYDRYRDNLPDGIEEVLFLNQDAEVCEGTICNIFIRQAKTLLTPPLHCGLLPGVLRQSLLESGEAVEQSIDIHQLASADQIYLGNSLRGLIPAVFTNRQI